MTSLEIPVLRVILALLALFAPLFAHGALLQVDNTGQLTGATGVDVNGTLWDVVFSDGAWDFSSGGLPATTKAEADLFSQALLDQVLLDSALGTFDSDPEMVNGCDNTSLCIFFTPYLVDPVYTYFSLAYNYRSGGVNSDNVRPLYGQLGLSGTFATGTETWVMGLWSLHSTTPPTSVPEPGTLSLLSAGLVAAFASRRRRNTRRTTT